MIESEVSTLEAADSAEESARVEADSSLQSLIESEVSTLEAADSVIDFRLDILEAKGFSKGYKIIEEELSYIDLDKKYENILFMSVGRLAVHENEDYVLSVIEGITRVTWIGSLASPDGEEKIELGDKVFWCGNF